MKFEDCMARIEEIVATLDAGEADLDESLKLYREGVELVRDCTKRLDEAAQTVKMLQMQPDGNMVLTDFAPAGETGEKA
jgi:exodeoxyribonuclease VII small subunit